MFGGAKPTFGSNANTGASFGSFNASGTTFGQSAFGKPPTTAFGATPTFGSPQSAPSVFSTNPGQQQSTGLFGQPNTTSGFGFSQAQQNTSIFGPTQTQQATPSLFGQTANTGFGAAVKPAGLGGFGQTAAPVTSSLFGQQAPVATSTSFGAFGQTAPTTGNVFGSGTTSAFGQPAVPGVNAGSSTAKYQPTMGTDTLMKSGQPNSVITKHHCITAMNDYEIKSLEEIRLEDYMANRKGPVAGAAGASFFGSTQPTSTNTGLFGTNQTTPSLFGQTNTGATENKSLFGANAFGQTANSAFGSTIQQQTGFLNKPFGQTAPAFGQTTTDSANLFGTKSAFGQTATPSLFGQTSTANTTPAFGQQNTFGGFGSPATGQQPSLFGTQTATDANKPTFGLGSVSTANTGFTGFGTTTTSVANTNLFGAKPAPTAFGTTPAFGTTATPNTGFTNFSLGNSFNNTMNKPATTAFTGFGTQTSTAPLNFNAGSSGSSLFNNTAAKPGGMFGSTLGTGNTATSGGIFSSGAFGTNTSLGGGTAFGTGTLGGSSVTSMNNLSTQTLQAMPIHQQILSKVTSPYGENAIYKDLKRYDETDAIRATNPAAQQPFIDSMSNSHFKVTTKENFNHIRIKPICSMAHKKSLFEGLDETDIGTETFTIKPNPRRLILKQTLKSSVSTFSLPKGSNNNSNNNGSGKENISSNQNNSVPSDMNRSGHNESFSNENVIPITQSVDVVGNKVLPGSRPGSAIPNEVENTGRESWLHPNNLQKVRQHNLNLNAGSDSPANNTLSELVPRQALETYRASTSNSRLSISSGQENPFEDQDSSSLKINASNNNNSSADIFINHSTIGPETSTIAEEPHDDYECEEHPTGITLKRIGYYTIPSLDDLKSYLAEDGSCVVPNFTVGRQGYGNVFFGKEMDVAGINIDEIVHFRNKEVIIYPDDDNKPPIGNGLNREAQVTLDQVWPVDKTKHQPIKDPQRLLEMDWELKLRRVCDKNDTRFIEYRPETGSWVFRVKHFSKYGLNDSDEEDDTPTDPKKLKIGTNPNGVVGVDLSMKTTVPEDTFNNKMTLAALKNAQKISEDAARAMDPKLLTAGMGGFYPMDESVDLMNLDKSQLLQVHDDDFMPHEIRSPTSVLAKTIGTNTHKLQLMKASFFADDNENKSDFVEPEHTKDFNRNAGPALIGSRSGDLSRKLLRLWKHAESAQLNIESSDMSSSMDFGLLHSPVIPPSLSMSVTSMLQDVQTEIDNRAAVVSMSNRLPPFTVKPKVSVNKIIAAQVPFCKSLAYHFRNKLASDMGLYNSRLFKMGTGPQETFVVPTTLNNVTARTQNEDIVKVRSTIFKPRQANDYSRTVLQLVRISSAFHYPNFQETIVDHLKIQLNLSIRLQVEGSVCPAYKSNNGTQLIVDHLNEGIKQINLGTFEEYVVSVWSLCLALWGDHEELEGRQANSHYAVMCRRNLLSDWLENSLTDKDLLTKTIMKNSYLDHILELVMCHKVEEACELAFKYDDGNLALLLSQLSSGPRVRRLMENQLAAWHKSKSDKFIQLTRLKLYMLVAGVSLMNSSDGPINTLDGIEWIKVLAVQLWYLSSPTCSITDALIAYEKSFKSEEFYSLPPSPNYEEKILNKVANPLYDLRYHLLQLFSKRSHSMEILLNPATHTADPMDYRLSWFMLETLEALGYHHCSELSESQLHAGFAAQLENNDLWEWAIFVLLHIKDRNKREVAVQNVLYRHATISKGDALSEKEKFIIESLGVPEKWIDYAKAVKAGSEFNYHLQAKFLLKAKQWSLAHDVIFEHIAADAIINDNVDYLYNLLSQFESSDPQRTVKVPNWSNRGQIFLDFIDINEKFKSLKLLTSEADIETRWENLKPQLADLCSRINLLPCPTPKHRLCQSEIAQNLACLVRGVLIVCPVLNPCLIIKIALDRLPLPQEFAQQELRTLLDTLVSDHSKRNVNSRDIAATT